MQQRQANVNVAMLQIAGFPLFLWEVPGIWHTAIGEGQLGVSNPTMKCHEPRGAL